jgi:hypothetical protein
VARQSIVQLQAVTKELQKSGYDVSGLVAVERELKSLERPPGLMSRLSGNLKQAAASQWRNLVGELQESREAFGLLRGALSGKRLSADERDKVRSQMLDLMRLFPAGLIAAANSAFPIPGTGLLTPWILRKMGLLPSRWREAHVLSELKKQYEKLEREGNHKAAARLRAIEHELEEQAGERDRIARDAQLLTHWDENNNGIWDADERVKYDAAVSALRAQLPVIASKKRWFFSYEGEVFGPLRLGELQKRGEPGVGLLCCYDGKSGWLAVGDLLGLEKPAVPLLQAADLPSLPSTELPENRKSRGPLQWGKESLVQAAAALDARRNAKPTLPVIDTEGAEIELPALPLRAR